MADHPEHPEHSDDELNLRWADHHDESEAPSEPEQDLPPPIGPEDPTDVVTIISSSDEPPLRFGAEDTGPLPHWTEPPTGEVPRILLDDPSSDDIAAWQSLTGSQPVWRDDRRGGYGDDEDEIDFSAFADDTPLGALDERPAPVNPFFDDEVETIKVGGPPTSGDAARVTPIRTRGTAARRRPGDEHGGFTTSRGTGGRNMPFAVGVGVAIAVAALILFALGAKYAMVLVVAALVLSAVELYEKLRERGYQPATLPGLAAVAGLPLAGYWRGEVGLPVVLFFALFATLVWFVLSGSLESGPLPNTAVTMLGVLFVGFLGSYAALILRLPDGVSLLLLTAAGVVAYDVFGLFVGSGAGRTQLAPWISPNKTVEGLVGGCLGVVLVVVICKFFGLSQYSDNLGQTLQLAAVIAVSAPLSDLSASMLKRNLDVKDFGTLLPGHGGVLDRFCSFLLVLPSVYYLTLVVKPG
jgi:phosphatidate cytidylyltransferase